MANVDLDKLRLDFEEFVNEFEAVEDEFIGVLRDLDDSLFEYEEQHKDLNTFLESLLSILDEYKGRY